MRTIEDYKFQIKQIIDSYKMESNEEMLLGLATYVVNEVMSEKHSLFREVVKSIEGEGDGKEVGN